MPHISVAMARSARRGVGEILVSSLLRRDTVTGVTGEVSSVKNSFSSWGNCMQASYCKWPVIAAIIIASLIVLSVVACIVRCACCGYSCCCACFSFLKCFDCCGDCCEGKKSKSHKHLDDEPFGGSGPSRNNQGYAAPAPMMGGGLGRMPEKPQFATFEVGRSGLAVGPKATLSEDALPPMPSWETASKKHVADEEKDAVELGDLDPATGQRMPLINGAAATGVYGPPSPAIGGGNSPYGARPGQGNGYMGVSGDQYGQEHAAFDSNGRAYSQPDVVANGRPYGNARLADTQQQNAYSGRGQGRGRGYDNRGRDYNGQGRGYGEVQSPQAYGEVTSPHDPYSPQEMYADNPGYVNSATAYNRPQPGREYSNDSRRPLNPDRQYSERSGNTRDNFQPRGQARGPGPNRINPPASNDNGFGQPRVPGRGQSRLDNEALNNNSGFDFGREEQSYGQNPNPSRQGAHGNMAQRRPVPPPQQEEVLDDYYGGYGGGSTTSPSYAARSPPSRGQQGIGDSNQRSYQPNSRGGRGGGREPQRWDPVQQ